MDPRTGQIAHEDSWDVRAVVPSNTDITARTSAVTETYRQLFSQQSIGVIIAPVCAHF
jgi:hypothetical protein